MKRPILDSAAYVLALWVLLTGCAGGEPSRDETGEPAEAPPAAQAPAPAPSGTGSFLDPDVATREELLTVPHVDATLAEALEAGRPSAAMVAVDDVLAATLSETQRDEVYARLWKPLDLNSASEEEILLIPGIGPEMAEEFEEYRPYRAIEQFRAEIGKYVDEAEVARLERYVTIR